MSNQIETQLPLDIQTNVMFDTTGTAILLAVGPETPFERWEIASISTSASSTSQSRLAIYNSPSFGTPLEGTYSGNQDTTDTKRTLMPGTSLSFQWTLGTPGAIATISLTGVRFIKGQRAY